MKKRFPYILFFTGSFCLLVSCNDLQQGQQPGKNPAVDISEEIPEEASEKELETSPEEIKGQLSKKEGDSTIVEFYELRSYTPVWSDPEKRAAFLDELQKADSEGLALKDYYNQQLRNLLGNAAELDEAEAAQLDLQLTEAYFSYAHDLYYGKLDPNELYKNWGVSRKKKDLAAILQQGLENDKFAETLQSLKPSHQIYRDLKVSLKEYAELRKKEASFDKIKEGDLIRPGERDPRLSSIANRLVQLGHLLGEFKDSVYSTKLQEAVKSYQKEKGLQVDALIGNSTIAELNMTANERYKQILANLERWRWYPRDLGEHYILINIPQFKLSVVKEGDTVRTHNVIAGTRARQTPIFSDTIRYVVINPTWTVPPTIKTKDVIPRASKDPNYLASHNMRVYKGGKPVEPSEIDWTGPQARSYTIVQRAGPSNPLGQIKIMYPNRYLIYLHDTPAQNLFSQNQRAESSGCVRVENAVDLSGYVLRDQEEWTEEKIREAIATGKTREVKINQPIQVHHFYWTAWRAGGKTVFTEDVYRLDKDIYSRLSID